MPAVLPTTPTAKTFSEGWAARFGEAVKVAAGRDGRLSITEARRMSERLNGDRFFSDNATNYLLAKGLKSTSVAKVVEAARAYALRQAAGVAGPDGRVSFADAKKLAPDLREDFLFLRGRIVEGTQPTHAQLVTDVRDLVLRAFDNGTAKKLAGPPATVRGRDELISTLPHAPSKTNLRTWVADGRVYVSRAASSPSPLVGWYDVGPMPTKSNMSALRARFDEATRDLWLTSESDAQLKFIASSAAVSGATTAELVKRHFDRTHDTLGPTLYGYEDPRFVKLADRRHVEVRNGYEWLSAQTVVHDPSDPAAVDAAARWKALEALVKSELADVKLVRFGEVNITVMLVGQTRTGELAGFMSAVVET